MICDAYCMYRPSIKETHAFDVQRSLYHDDLYEKDSTIALQPSFDVCILKLIYKLMILSFIMFIILHKVLNTYYYPYIR